MPHVLRFAGRWLDLRWMSERSRIIQAFESATDVLYLDFKSCEWIDLQALTDLLLQSVTALRNHERLAFSFTARDTAPARVFRFLSDSGFLPELADQCPPGEFLTFDIDGEAATVADLARASTHLPQPILRTAFLIKCRVVDCSSFADRHAVFSYCRELREEVLTKRFATITRYGVPIIREAKVCLGAILPELLDNVRLHKPERFFGLAAFVARVRFRESSSQGVPRIAETDREDGLTELQKRTQHYWQNDVLELAFSDDGPGIQDTWLQAQRRHHPTREVRHPVHDRRLSSHNGDFELLQAIFEHRVTSLDPTTRQQEGLPVHTTGLYAVQRCIANTSAACSVLSGESYVVVAQAEARDTNGEAAVVVSQAGRFARTPGVHFLFRLSARHGRPIEGWPYGLPQPLIAQPRRLASTSRLPRSCPHLLEELTLPRCPTLPGDVLLVRINHVPTKTEIYTFLVEVREAQLFLAFVELPPEYALRLYELLTSLQRDIECIVPVITDSYQVRVVSRTDSLEATRSFIGGNGSGAYWWTSRDAPVDGVASIYEAVRDFDSRRFWELVATSPAYLPRHVQWTPQVRLTGGFLNVALALANREIRKILRKRVVVLAQLLKARTLRAARPALAILAADVERNAYLAPEATCEIILDGVCVTGGTARRHASNYEDVSAPRFYLPLLRYPAASVVTSAAAGAASPSPALCVLDWLAPAVESEGEPLRRYSDTDRVGPTDRRAFVDLSVNQSSSAYRSWQRNDLLRIGHYNAGSHHYWVWLDVRRFLQDDVAETDEMFTRMAKQLLDWSVTHVFYVDHPAAQYIAESVLALGEPTLAGLPTLPVSEIAALEFVQGHSGTSGDGKYDPAIGVVIDDGVVSGATVRRARAQLLQKGFRRVHTMAVVDRCDAQQAIGGLSSEAEHFAWWTLRVPGLDPDRCLICDGNRLARQILTETNNTVLRDLLTGWVEDWSVLDSQEQPEGGLPGVALSAPVEKRLGNVTVPNVRLESSEAFVTHALEIATRLSLPTYGIDRASAPPSLACELIAGSLLHFWRDFPLDRRTETIYRAVQILWDEERRMGRSLLALILLPLLDEWKDELLSGLRRTIVERGIPHADALTFVHAVATRQPDLLDTIEALPAATDRAISEPVRTLRRRTLAALAALRGDRAPVSVKESIVLLGIPGRHEEHHEVLRLLDRVAERPSSDIELGAMLRMLAVHLHPIRTAVREHRSLLHPGLTKALETAFGNLEILTTAHTSTSARREAREETVEHKHVCNEIRYLLSIDTHGLGPTVREVFAAQFLHYLPFVVRNVLKRVVEEPQLKPRLREQDFVVVPALLRAESLLLSNIPLNSLERARFEGEIGVQDLVLAPRAQLEQAVRDCLLDATHPKRNDTAMESQAYMTVAYTAEKVNAGPGWTARLEFANRCDKEHYKRSESGNWLGTSALVETLGGRTARQWSNGVLHRVFIFPLIARSHTEALDDEGNQAKATSADLR